MIAGAVGGSVGGVFLIFAFAIFFVRKFKHSRQETAVSSGGKQSNSGNYGQLSSIAPNSYDVGRVTLPEYVVGDFDSH